MTVKPTCNDCVFWDPYAPGLGECTEYLKRRARAWVGTSEGFTARWPYIPAPDTKSTDTCEKHKPIT